MALGRCSVEPAHVAHVEARLAGKFTVRWRSPRRVVHQRVQQTVAEWLESAVEEGLQGATGVPGWSVIAPLLSAGFTERGPRWSRSGNPRLVPLHRGFDELIVAGAEGRQRLGIDQHLDASGYAGAASDQPVAFEREHHLVD